MMAKDFIKEGLVRSHALRWAARLTPSSAAILMYHSVQEEPERYAHSIGLGIIHSASVFRKQMEIVARYFKPVPLADVALFLRGERSLPARSVVITFDDGFRDNALIAAPILNHFGIPAVFYLTAGLIGTSESPWYCRVRHAFATTKASAWKDPADGRTWGLSTSTDRIRASETVWDRCSAQPVQERQYTVKRLEEDLDVQSPAFPEPLMMSWSEARSLHNMGHQLGSHTMSHPNIAHVSEADARWELAESKRVLESEIGVCVEHFSYPHPALNPNWNAKTLALSQEAGYQTAVITIPSVVRAGVNPLALNRVSVGRSLGEFLWNLDSAFLRPPL